MTEEKANIMFERTSRETTPRYQAPCGCVISSAGWDPCATHRPVGHPLTWQRPA